MEIIRTVEQSELSVRRTLEELGINRSTFYNWYRRYSEDGYDGLADKRPNARRFWNKIPESVKEEVVQIALEHPDKSPRELAPYIIDTQGNFISESSVYRILKEYDLITSPNYIVMSAKDSFTNPTKRVHELWQTDFTYFSRRDPLRERSLAGVGTLYAQYWMITPGTLLPGNCLASA